MPERVSRSEIVAYEPEQAHVLIRLLAEYTDKLGAACEKSDAKAQRRRVLLLLLTVSVVCVVFAFADLLRNDSHIEVMKVGVGVLIGIVLGSAVSIWEQPGKGKHGIQLEIATSAAQLERLIRRSSQIVEYAGVSFAEKLELDFRLADAEAMLIRSTRYTGERNREENGLVHAEIFK